MLRSWWQKRTSRSESPARIGAARWASRAGLGDAERLATIAEPALGLDLTHLELIRILDRRQRFRKRNRTRAITGQRSSKAERIMRAHQVVAIAKGVELALAVFEAGEVEVAQNFELERAMEALVLALGLRMVRTAVGDADPEPISHRLRPVNGCAPAAPHGEPLSINIAAGKP